MRAASGLPEAFSLESTGDQSRFSLGPPAFLCNGARDVANRLKKSPVVEPVDPFDGGVLDGFEGSPRPASMDHLGLIKAVDPLDESIVARVPPLLPRRPWRRRQGVRCGGSTRKSNTRYTGIS